MRTLLMLSYHYPPLGGSGSMRALRFSRYLPGFGWRPAVIAVEGGGLEPRDPALASEIPPEAVVRRIRCLEPDDFSDGWDRPASKIVRNLFKTFDSLLVPDDRAFWRGPATRAGARLARELGASAIWATGPPFTALLAGAALHRATGLPLIADLRDDWTGFNPSFRRRAPRRQAREAALEAEVLAAASAVVSVTPGIVEALRARRPAGVPADRFHLIPNGFDPAHFASDPPPHRGGTSDPPPHRGGTSDPGFRILHAGSLYASRSPGPFLEGLRRWLQARPEARPQTRVELLGRLEPSLARLLEAPDLEGLVERTPFLPHAQSLARIRQADLLLLVVDQVDQADQVFTGKVFEYLGSRRPILGLVPSPSPLASLLAEAGSAVLAPPSDPEGIAAALEQAWRRRLTPPAPDPAVLERHDARALSGRLAALLEAVGG